MWPFGKDKKGKKGGKSVPAKPMTSKDAKAQVLLEQMRTLRAEIGEENLQNLVKKLKFEELKDQVRRDIDHDEGKRDKLLDDLRWHLHDHDRQS